MIFVNSTNYTGEKIKDSITAPNKSMNIHEQHVSCNMSYNNIDENDNLLTAHIQNNGYEGIKNAIVICIFITASFLN